MFFDIYYKVEREDEEVEEYNDDMFYDFLELKMLMIFKFCLNLIVNIVLLGNFKFFILIKERVYECDV